MSVLRIDSVGGASGDMLLAALSDLGADLTEIADHIRKLLPDPFDIEVTKLVREGLQGTCVRVRNGEAGARLQNGCESDLSDESDKLDHDHAGHHHGHEHHHGREQDHVHSHGAASPHAHGVTHGHAPHRGLAEIHALLASSSISEQVSAMTRDVFTALAEAEAQVHGTTPEQIHFHEVGAVDAIVDITGCCLALEALGVDSVQVGPLPIGSGTVVCRHGTMPVPAPATMLLLRDHPVVPTQERCELVTPTGAALLRTWSRRPLPPPPWRAVRAGVGFGHHKLSGRPNLVRATLFEPCADATSGKPEMLCVLETNVDDCPAEWIGALFKALPPLGALDVWTVPAGMKKSRPGTVVNVLCRPDAVQDLAAALFAQTTTFGIRVHDVRRLSLERRIQPVSTAYGEVRVKVGCLGERVLTRSPEHEDCARLADEHGVSVRTVYEAASVKEEPHE